MSDPKNIYFLTLENISDYNLNEGNLSEDELVNRVLLNLKLAKENSSLEKRQMLLNNCLITFRNYNGLIPSKLFFDTYYEIIKFHLNHDINYTYDLVSQLLDEFKNFSQEDMDLYGPKLMYLLVVIVNKGYSLEEIEIVLNLIKKANLLFSKIGKNDSVYLNYAKIVVVYANILFEAERVNDAFATFKQAYQIVSLVEEESSEKVESLASISFSLGNILYQCDVYDEAMKFFSEVINICLNNEFDSKFELLHLGYNYLSQVMVYTNEYDKAIETILDYFLVSKDLYSGEQYDYICADFYYRLGLIYYKFKCDFELGLSYMNKAKSLLISIENKNDKILDLLDTIDEYINKMED